MHPRCRGLDPLRILYGFWHGRQLLLVPTFRGSGIVVMTDLSWAGEIQAGILSRLGYTVVRGSSRRRGLGALAAVKRAIERGQPAAFALDGPRGPAEKSKPGILYLAERLDVPIVPLATSARPAWTVPGTWCRYLFPLPFSRCRVALGEPVTVADGGLTSERLDEIVSALTTETDRAVGRRVRGSSVSGYVGDRRSGSPGST